MSIRCFNLPVKLDFLNLSIAWFAAFEIFSDIALGLGAYTTCPCSESAMKCRQTSVVSGSTAVCECSPVCAHFLDTILCLFVVFNLYLKGRRTFSDGEAVPACFAHASMYLATTHSGLSTHRFNATIDEIIFNENFFFKFSESYYLLWNTINNLFLIFY